MLAMNSFSVLALPNASISKSGFARAAASVAASETSTDFLGDCRVAGQLVVDERRVTVGRDAVAVAGVRDR